MIRGETTKRTADIVRKMILEGRFSNLAPLRQSKLAQELGVSRVPLREAFQLLEAEGLIALRTNRGAIVTLPSPEEIGELAEMRAKIECWLLKQAINYASNADYEQQEHCCSLMQTCEDTLWSGHNMAFHEALLAPANKIYIIDHLKALHERLFRSFRSPIVSVRDREKQAMEHEEIFELYRKMDTDAAAARLEAHILVSARQAVDHVRSLYRQAEQRSR